MKVLFQTEVGSRMWGMEDLSSDYDVFDVYQTPTVGILKGYTGHNTLPHRQYMDGDREIDRQCMEIGHLVNLLLKGNVNMIWAVTSPIVHMDGRERKELCDIVKNNLAKVTYFSIRGMAQSQLADMRKRASVRDAMKSKLTALRTLKFGIRFLSDGVCDYTVMQGMGMSDVSDETISITFEALNTAYECSTLPLTVPHTQLREFLLRLRIADLKESGVI